MKIRLIVNTPPGEAEGTEKKLKYFLLGLTVIPNKTGVNPDKSSFYWEIDGSIKQYVAIMRKVTLFQSLAGGTIDNRLVRKAFKQFGATEAQFKEVSKMLKEGTEIKVIKEATANEIVSYNKTYWQKVKELFKG